MLVVVAVGDQVVDDAAVASSQHSVYCALPGSIFAEVVGQRRVDELGRARPGDHRLAEVADVEDADRLADGGVLLDHAGGVLQRHRPAAELGELRAERHVPVVRAGELLERSRPWREPTAARPSRRTPPASMPRVTTYTPPQRQPRQDPSRRRGRGGASQSGKGPRLARRRRRTSPRPTAAAAARCWPRSASTGKAGEVVKVPDRAAGQRPAARARRASASDPADAASPYAAPPASPPAASPTPRRSPSPCRPTTPELVARGDRGLPPRRLHVHRRTRPRRRDDHRSPRRRRPQPDRAQGRTPSPPSSDAQVVADAVARHPRLGQHAAARPARPPLFADARRGRARRSPRAAGAEGDARGPRREAARRARAAAASSASATARPRRRGWSS